MIKNILDDDGIVYHGIGTDLIKFISIMQYGIISKYEANKRNICYANNYDGYNLRNQNDWVCSAISSKSTKVRSHGAFNTYISDGVSFAINSSDWFLPSVNSTIYSGFDDEVYLRSFVNLQDIIGIMVPECILNSKISELPFGLKKMGTGLIENRCYNTIKFLQQQFGYIFDIEELDKLFEAKKKLSLTSFEDRDEIIKKADIFMSKYIERCMQLILKKEDIVFGDVINYFNQGIPLYNSEGVKIKDDVDFHR